MTRGPPPTACRVEAVAEGTDVASEQVQGSTRRDRDEHHRSHSMRNRASPGLPRSFAAHGCQGTGRWSAQVSPICRNTPLWRTLAPYGPLTIGAI